MLNLFLDPMFDQRLTREHVEWEVWQYMFEMDKATYPVVSGIALGDPRYGYDAGQTPRQTMTEIWSKAIMDAAIDNVPELVRWVNNHALDLGKFGKTYRQGCNIMIGHDAKGWILQFWYLDTCYDHMRFDPRAPAPPGYVEKVQEQKK